MHYYFFKKGSGDIITKDEVQADRLIFHRSSWEDQTIKYIGRVPKKIYDVFVQDRQMDTPWVRDSTSLSPKEQAEIQQKRKEHQEKFFTELEALVKETNDMTLPEDHTVMDNFGRKQTNQNILRSLPQ